MVRVCACSSMQESVVDQQVEFLQTLCHFNCLICVPQNSLNLALRVGCGKSQDVLGESVGHHESARLDIKKAKVAIKLQGVDIQLQWTLGHTIATGTILVTGWCGPARKMAGFERSAQNRQVLHSPCPLRNTRMNRSDRDLGSDVGRLHRRGNRCSDCLRILSHSSMLRVAAHAEVHRQTAVCRRAGRDEGAPILIARLRVMSAYTSPHAAPLAATQKQTRLSCRIRLPAVDGQWLLWLS